MVEMMTTSSDPLFELEEKLSEPHKFGHIPVG